MKLLVLGGTVFLGRHVVEAAVARGDDVTIFNRGRTSPGLFPEVQSLRGERDGGLSALEGREWDAVVDTSGYVPRVVAQSAELLADAARVYCFVSSISVYADFATGPDETSDVASLENEATEDVDAEYGGLKAACEDVVRSVFGERALVVRPGLIVGPHDPTGRFTYWPVRVARGGEVLAPAPPDRGVQVIDVRDLASWILDLATRREGGTLNAVAAPTTFDRLLADCAAHAPTQPEVAWVEEAFLLEHDVAPWTELPLWIPGPNAVGHADVSTARAFAAGLAPRPLAETIVDTLAWAASLSGDPARQEDGRYRVRTLTPERERELLAAWHGR